MFIDLERFGPMGDDPAGSGSAGHVYDFDTNGLNIFDAGAI